MSYKEEFIRFMVESGVLTFGDFTTKSGRKTPYFVNTGNYKTGAQAAKLGAALIKPGSGALTGFEKACDDAVTNYLSAGRRVPFGEQVVIGYLYARENEMTAIRIIMSGRLAGLNGDTIRERLRDSYV